MKEKIPLFAYVLRWIFQGGPIVGEITVARFVVFAFTIFLLSILSNSEAPISFGKKVSVAYGWALAASIPAGVFWGIVYPFFQKKEWKDERKKEAANYIALLLLCFAFAFILNPTKGLGQIIFLTTTYFFIIGIGFTMAYWLK